MSDRSPSQPDPPSEPAGFVVNKRQADGALPEAGGWTKPLTQGVRIAVARLKAFSFWRLMGGNRHGVSLRAAGSSRATHDAALPPADARTQELSTLLNAIAFAADRHRGQRRKGCDAAPYINHPIEVARILVMEGGLGDGPTLVAAVLHDTLEDTATSAEELERLFGRAVRSLVEEVTDDKLLPKERRKHLQVEHAAALSLKAQQIKVADKIANVRDIIGCPPVDWSVARRREYVEWSERVVAGCHEAATALGAPFEAAALAARTALRMECDHCGQLVAQSAQAKFASVAPLFSSSHWEFSLTRCPRCEETFLCEWREANDWRGDLGGDQMWTHWMPLRAGEIQELLRTRATGTRDEVLALCTETAGHRGRFVQAPEGSVYWSDQPFSPGNILTPG